MSDSPEFRVLHVDDDPDFADLAAEMLEREDDRLAVETAPSAAAGLDRLAEAEVDCVVSDYRMPGLTGLEFLEAVREDHPDLPFILYTGKGSEAVASEAVAAGATDYLRKGRVRGGDGDTGQFELLANRIRNAVEQYRARRRAAELDRIRSLLSEINQALVRADSRADVESRVCEILTDADPYLFAWIGAADSASEGIEPRASAGADAGYLEEITRPDGDGGPDQGPAGRALRDRRVAVTQDVRADPDFESRREAALDRGYRAVAAVPLEYEAVRYGTLSVYADRPDAFDEHERELLAELGGDIGHAIHSLELKSRLREERDRRRALFENAPNPVLVGEGDANSRRIVEVNDAFEEVFGYEAAAVLDTDVTETIVPEDERADHEDYRKRAMAGESITAEVERLTADGRRQFLLQVIPYGLDGSGPEGTYVWYTDITERTERERELRRYEAYLEESTDVITVLDEDGTITYQSPAVERVLGYDRDEFAGRNAFDYIHPDDVDGIAETFAELIAEPGSTATVEGRFRTAADDWRWLEIRATNWLERDAINGIVTNGRDITERKENQQELERTNTVLSSLVETLPVGVLAEDADRNVLAANDRLCELFGFSESPESVVGSDCDQLAREVSDRFVEPERFRTRIDELVAAEESVRNEELSLRDGRTFARDYEPLAFPSGEGHLWVYRDITERKQRERSLRRERDRLDEFASVVSHDLQNPLNVAAGRLDLLGEECDSEHLEAIESAIDRMDRITEDVLWLAREGRDVGSTAAVEIGDVLDAAWELVADREADAELHYADGIRTATIEADENRLRQLVENLFSNAIEHGGEDVTVTVGAMENGFYVEDDGPGIPEDRRADIFTAGFSTSESGTGFGLRIVEQIAVAHGWEIGVTAGTAGGARFEITGVEFR
ncbi:MAG: PAS domain S-box protein [Halodesulfurarchaeum sp.]